MRTFALALIISTLVIFGCSSGTQQPAQAAEPPLTPEQIALNKKGPYRATWKSEPELKDTMNAMMEDNAEALWNVQLDEHAPKTDDDWKKLEHSAITLEQLAKYLKEGHFAKNNPDWPKDSDVLLTIAQTMRKNVQEKKRDDLIDSGDALNQACTDCHNKYFEDN